MRRVPNITAVLEEAKRAGLEAQQEKTAAVEERELTVPLAAGLLKLATQLRKEASAEVSYDDVAAFGKRVLEECP